MVHRRCSGNQHSGTTVVVLHLQFQIDKDTMEETALLGWCWCWWWWRWCQEGPGAGAYPTTNGLSGGPGCSMFMHYGPTATTFTGGGAGNGWGGAAGNGGAGGGADAGPGLATPTNRMGVPGIMVGWFRWTDRHWRWWRWWRRQQLALEVEQVLAL